MVHYKPTKASHYSPLTLFPLSCPLITPLPPCSYHIRDSNGALQTHQTFSLLSTEGVATDPTIDTLIQKWNDLVVVASDGDEVREGGNVYVLFMLFTSLFTTHYASQFSILLNSQFLTFLLSFFSSLRTSSLLLCSRCYVV